METGIAALKFGVALIFLPFGFVYLPPLLLNGSFLQVAYTFIILLIGFMAVAMTLQGSDFIRPKIDKYRRVLYGIAAMILLLPAPVWLNFIGVGMIAAGWFPAFITHRRARVATETQSAA